MWHQYLLNANIMQGCIHYPWRELMVHKYISIKYVSNLFVIHSLKCVGFLSYIFGHVFLKITRSLFSFLSWRWSGRNPTPGLSYMVMIAGSSNYHNYNTQTSTPKHPACSRLLWIRGHCSFSKYYAGNSFMLLSLWIASSGVDEGRSILRPELAVLWRLLTGT